MLLEIEPVRALPGEPDYTSTLEATAAYRPSGKCVAQLDEDDDDFDDDDFDDDDFDDDFEDDFEDEDEDDDFENV